MSDIHTWIPGDLVAAPREQGSPWLYHGLDVDEWLWVGPSYPVPTNQVGIVISTARATEVSATSAIYLLTSTVMGWTWVWANMKLNMKFEERYSP